MRRKPRPEILALDALCREVVMLRDRGCVRCRGSSGLEWAHVHSRSRHSLRWDLDNSLVLCRACHAWWHENRTEAAAWWEKAYPDRMRRLVARKPSKPDLAGIRAALGGVAEKFVGSGHLDDRAVPREPVPAAGPVAVLAGPPIQEVLTAYENPTKSK